MKPRRLKMGGPVSARSLAGGKWRLFAMTFLLLMVLVLMQSLARLQNRGVSLLPEFPEEHRIKNPELPTPGQIAVGLANAGKSPAQQTTREDDFVENFPPSPPLAETIFEPLPLTEDAWVLPKSLFEEIEDNQLGSLRKEHKYLQAILGIVRQAPPGELEQRGMADVLHAVLMLQPDDYRRHLITLTGAVHQLEKVSQPQEADVFEAWISTDDSGTNLVRVLITECVDVAPTERLPAPVTVTAYFIKRYAYQPKSQVSVLVAPMLIGKSLVRRPAETPNAAVAANSRRLWMLAILGATALVALFTSWFAWTSRNDRRRLTQRSSELTFDLPPEPPPSTDDSPQAP